MNSPRYLESRQRGSLDFPLEYHYLCEGHPRYQMPYHWHEEIELLHVLRGEFDLTLDGESLTLHAGDVVFIAAEQLHGGIPRCCDYECIVFDLQLLLKCSAPCRQQLSDVRHRRISLRAYYPAHDSIIGQGLPAMFRALREQCLGYELITLGELYRFFGEVYRQGAYVPLGQGQEEGRWVGQLKQVFELIETSYSSRLTLEDMARAVHMTPKYFCRFFKAATHRTPVDYLNYYRIEAACNEMVLTEKTLTEIALDCGFSNPNYFIRQFKKYKGQTPGKYQASIRRSR
ncbi:MAG: helix-turn-helix domain-containing protein [Aristaeellaceae bacterium]